MLRHLVAADNLGPDGIVVDPTAVRHGDIAARHVAALAGPIDPLTHLNLEFPTHQLLEAIVVARLEVGAPVLIDANGYRWASIPETAFERRGQVRLGARRAAWQAAFAR